MSIEWAIRIAAAGAFALLAMIVLVARRNARETIVTEENPRKAFYDIRCRECKTPTAHGALTDGLCSTCSDKADAAAPVDIEITMPMLNAGADELRKYPGRDSLTTRRMFDAMLAAMPLEQKRVLLRHPAFQTKRDKAA